MFSEKETEYIKRQALNRTLTDSHLFVTAPRIEKEKEGEKAREEKPVLRTYLVYQ
jgi:hypothetical protein